MGACTHQVAHGVDTRDHPSTDRKAVSDGEDESVSPVDRECWDRDQKDALQEDRVAGTGWNFANETLPCWGETSRGLTRCDRIYFPSC